MAERGEPDDPSRGVPLLDQVSSGRLARAAGSYEARRVEVPPARRPSSATLPRRALRLGLLTLLPLGLFALAAVMLFGLARATAGSLAGDGGFSAADVAMLALLVIAGLTVATQAMALLRRHPLGRRALAGVGSLRRPRVAAAPGSFVPGRPIFLARVSEEVLAELAPPDLGSGSRIAAAARTGRRAGDTLLWVALGAISVGVAGLAAFGAGFSLWRAIERGGFSPALAVLAAFCLMAFFGLAMMARTTFAAIFDPRRRKRRPAVIRLVRYASRPISHGDGGASTGASVAVSAAVTAVAAVSMVSAAFWPEVSDALESLGSDEPLAAVAEQQTQAPTQGAATAPPATSTNTAAAVAGTTPTPASAPTPTPTRTPTPTPTPTKTPTPGPTPTRTLGPPTPTLGRPLESDGDGVIDPVEYEFDSDPGDPDSTPEDWRYDSGYQKDTCRDGVDNDRDDLADAADPGCQ